MNIRSELRDRALGDPVAPPKFDQESHLDRVETYYEDTWIDYRFTWMNEENRALHFGYWAPGIKSHADSLLEMNRVMADAAHVGPGDRILDAGCGVGGTAMWLVENFDVTVDGITISSDQVLRPRRYRGARGLQDRLTFDQQDYLATTFESEAFDVVWAQESACHAVDKQALLHEFARLLRPGGRLIMTDYFLQPREGTKDAELVRTWLDGWVVPNVPGEREWREMVAAAGMSEIELRDVSDSVQKSLRRLGRTVRMFSPLLSVMHRNGGRSDTQRGNTAGSIAQWRAYKRGLWRFALITARKAGPSSAESSSGRMIGNSPADA